MYNYVHILCTKYYKIISTKNRLLIVSVYKKWCGVVGRGV